MHEVSSLTGISSDYGVDTILISGLFCSHVCYRCMSYDASFLRASREWGHNAIPVDVLN